MKSKNDQQRDGFSLLEALIIAAIIAAMAIPVAAQMSVRVDNATKTISDPASTNFWPANPVPLGSLTNGLSTWPGSTNLNTTAVGPLGSAATNASGDFAPVAHVSATNNPHSVTATQVGLGSVEDTALSTWAGSTNLDTVGTVTNGSWQGTPVAASYLSATAVTPGTYGTTNAAPALTVDQQGRITAATNSSITPASIGAEPAGVSSSDITDSTAAGRAMLTAVDSAAQAALLPVGYAEVANTNYAASQNDRVIAVTSIAASRVITLPSASSVAAGTQVIVQDISGSVSSSITLTIQRAGSDTIFGTNQENASVTSVVNIRPGFTRFFYSNGVNRWFEPSAIFLRRISFPTDTNPNTGISWEKDGTSRISGVTYDAGQSKLRVVSNKRVDLLPGGDAVGDGFIQMGNADNMHDYAFLPGDGTPSGATDPNMPSKALLFNSIFWNGSSSAFKTLGLQGDVDTAGKESLLFLVAGNTGGVTPSFTRTIRGTVVAKMSSTGLLFPTVTGGISFKEGSNARMGQATLVNGTITVSNTSVTANTRIFLTRASKGSSTAIGALEDGTITAETSFVINALKSDASTETGDLSVVNWLLVEPAP